RSIGETQHFAVRISSLADKNGNITGFISTSNNVTERKQAEERIQQQNTFLNNIIESLSHPFYVIEANDYRIVAANSSARALGDDTIKTCYALTHNRRNPCDGVEHPCPLQEIKQTKKPLVVEHIHLDKDGNPRNFEVHGFPILNSEGEVVQMIEYALDITERKRAEEALKKAQNYISNIIDSMPSVLVGVDPDGKVTQWNTQAQRATGVSVEEAVGQPLARAFPRLAAEMERVRQAMQTRKVYSD
ncbi:MAG: PAS domain-containing protein, partial [Proteobacteria bacterium]|nr:PAS domain-containing protein [Pseudomonadota bacterium]